MKMRKKDIECYRDNYDKSWLKYGQPNGMLMLPFGAILAIQALCDEIDRLNKWGSTRKDLSKS
jgi:hypothetical protein